MKKLERSEMKTIMGGKIAPPPESDTCKGIIECPTLEVGDSCGPLQPGCTCRQTSDGKVCNP